MPVSETLAAPRQPVKASHINLLAAAVNAAAFAAAVADTKATDARSRSLHTGTQIAATISDLPEAVQDLIGTFLIEGAGIALVYDDVANTLRIDATGSGGGGGGPTDAEVVRDIIATALRQSGLITVTVDDAGDTITIGTTATANASDSALRDRSTHIGTQDLDTTTDSATRMAMSAGERQKIASVALGATLNAPDAELRDRSTHTGTQGTSTITGLLEYLQDQVALMLAGTHTGLTVAYDDNAGTLTLVNTAAAPPLTVKTVDYQMLVTDQVVLASAGAVIHLPSAVTAGASGKVYTVKNNAATGNVTLRSLAGTIDGGTVDTLEPYVSRSAVSNGSNWSLV